MLYVPPPDISLETQPSWCHDCGVLRLQFFGLQQQFGTVVSVTGSTWYPYSRLPELNVRCLSMSQHYFPESFSSLFAVSFV